MARYFSRTPTNGSPSEANTQRYVNGQPLPAGAAHCHLTAEGLMRDDALLTLVTDPSVDVGSWAIAEVEVDPVSVIVPASDEALSGVFAVVLAEIKRTPLVEWIDRHATQGTPGEQDAAMALQLFLDVSRNP